MVFHSLNSFKTWVIVEKEKWQQKVLYNQSICKTTLLKTHHTVLIKGNCSSIFLSCLSWGISVIGFYTVFSITSLKMSFPHHQILYSPKHLITRSLLHFFYFPKEYKAALKVNPSSSLYQSSSTWISVLLCFLRNLIQSSAAMQLKLWWAFSLFKSAY